MVYVFAVSLTTSAADWLKLTVATEDPNWLQPMTQTILFSSIFH